MNDKPFLQMVDNDHPRTTRSEAAIRQQSQPQPEDGDLIARALMGAMRAETTVVPKRRNKLALAAAAALLLGGGSASAWIATRPPTPTQPPTLSHEHAPTMQAAVSPQPAPPAPPVAVPVNPAPPKAMQKPTSARPSADALLQQAGQRAREGRAHDALKIYRRLQQQYAQTREAVVSGVSVGQLLLNKLNQPAAALKAFNRHLQRGTQTPLYPEALAGKARALEALGRTEQAATAWTALLQADPDSLYRNHAQRYVEQHGSHP